MASHPRSVGAASPSASGARGYSRYELAVGLVKATRPLNALMVFVAAVIGGLIAGLRPEDALLPALSASLISMGAQAVNDYFDVEVDRKKGKENVLTKGLLRRDRFALFWASLFLLGVLLAFFISPAHAIVAAAVSALAFLYSERLQAKKYVGNIVVSLLVALSLIYGGLGGSVEKTLLSALIVFLANWGREIYKDVADAEADYPYKISLPHILTERWAGFLASYLLFLAVILLPFPYLTHTFGEAYVVLSIPAALIALWAVTQALRGNYVAASRYTKAAMGVALLAYLAGVVA